MTMNIFTLVAPQVEHTWLPPLRRISETVTTQVQRNGSLGCLTAVYTRSDMCTERNLPPQTHVRETVDLEAVTAIFGKTGLNFSTIVTPFYLFIWSIQYTSELESLLGRWSAGDHSLLQPAISSPAGIPLVALTTMMVKSAGAKEVELLGLSGASGHVTGASAAGRGVAEALAAGRARQEET
jgi:hypothetical protein